jgi:hypothetical protein
MIYLKSALAGLSVVAIFLILLFVAARSALTGADTYFLVFHFKSPALFFIWLSASAAYFFVSRGSAKSVRRAPD